MFFVLANKAFRGSCIELFNFALCVMRCGVVALPGEVVQNHGNENRTGRDRIGKESWVVDGTDMVVVTTEAIEQQLPSEVVREP